MNVYVNHFAVHLKLKQLWTILQLKTHKASGFVFHEPGQGLVGGLSKSDPTQEPFLPGTAWPPRYRREVCPSDAEAGGWHSPGGWSPFVIVVVSRSVMSDSLQPHGLQHARLPCPSPSHHLLELAHTHVHWVGDAIQPSHPLSSPSPPA